MNIHSEILVKKTNIQPHLISRIFKKLNMKIRGITEMAENSADKDENGGSSCGDRTHPGNLNLEV